MEISILDLTGNTLKFILSDSHVAFANALRRIAFSEVPCMCVEDVFFYENTSVLSDESIAHRLGFIPIKTDLDTYVQSEECTCKSEMGCNRCRALVTLDVEALQDKTIYSGDLKFENPDIGPSSDKIPIIRLGRGQKLKLEAYAKLGLGKQHAKWQPVAVSTYKFMPIIEINKKTCDACGICVASCPKKVLKIDEDKLVVDKILECNLCLECVKVCQKKPPAIEVMWDETKFIFTLESTGCLPPKRILLKAAEILMNKADNLIIEIKQTGGKIK